MRAAAPPPRGRSASDGRDLCPPHTCGDALPQHRHVCRAPVLQGGRATVAPAPCTPRLRGQPRPPGACAGGCGTTAPAPRRLGLLALALGSGAVQVLAVPDPRALAAALPPPAARAAATAQSSAADAAAPGAAPAPPAAAPPLAALRPAAEAPAGCLGASLPGALEWLPAPPHDLLLVRPGPVARV